MEVCISVFTPCFMPVVPVGFANSTDLIGACSPQGFGWRKCFKYILERGFGGHGRRFRGIGQILRCSGWDFKGYVGPYADADAQGRAETWLRFLWKWRIQFVSVSLYLVKVGTYCTAYTLYDCGAAGSFVSSKFLESYRRSYQQIPVCAIGSIDVMTSGTVEKCAGQAVFPTIRMGNFYYS
jgi:hypothetical protein